jgi:hypothetical protein
MQYQGAFAKSLYDGLGHCGWFPSAEWSAIAAPGPAAARRRMALFPRLLGQHVELQRKMAGQVGSRRSLPNQSTPNKLTPCKSEFKQRAISFIKNKMSIICM